RIIGGTFRIVVRGRGINLSFVGRGNIIVNGAGTDDDGSYAVNGGDYNPIPAFAPPLALSATPPPPHPLSRSHPSVLLVEAAVAPKRCSSSRTRPPSRPSSRST